MGKIVGIDLGTTNSFVAVLEGGEPVVRSQPPDRAKIEAQVKTLKEAMPGEDARRIRTQTSELQQAVMILGQAAYGGAAATEPGSPDHPGDNGHTEPRGEDLVEGEFSEM